MTGRRLEGGLWFAVLIAAAAATAIGILLLYLGSFILPSGQSGHKGGAGPSPFIHEVPFDLMLAGMVGIVVGVTGIWRSRRSWRRLSVVSTVCGAFAVLLTVPAVAVPVLSISFSYAGLWLGGLLSLVAIGAAIGAFILPMRNKPLDISLAVVGLLAGLLCVPVVGWILLITVGGGLG